MVVSHHGNPTTDCFINGMGSTVSRTACIISSTVADKNFVSKKAHSNNYLMPHSHFNSGRSRYLVNGVLSINKAHEFLKQLTPHLC